MTGEYVYNPLDRSTFEAVAYNAIGRASEVNNYPAYSLIHSTGNSGWSVGFMQWDFGQNGRGAKADEMLALYQQFTPENERYSELELASLSTRLQTRGQTGNELTAEEKTALNTFLHSDDGRTFVSGLNQQQVERKWENVGQPLSEITWLQDLSRSAPKEAAEIIAMTAKLYNQNQVRGGRFIEHLEGNTLTSEQASDWIGNQGIDGLNQSARAAIVSGRDKALVGVRLMNSLETGDGQVSQIWHDQVHVNGDVELTANFNNSPAAQLLDKMMRDPLNGESIRAQLDDNTAAQRLVMSGTDETARVELTSQGVLTVRSPEGVVFGLTQAGWTRDGELMQPNLRQLIPPSIDAALPGMPIGVGQIEHRFNPHQQPELPRAAAPQHPAQNPQNQAHPEQPNRQQQPQAPDAPPAGPPRRVDLDLRDRDHPDFALHQQALNLVHKHDEKLGRTPDEKTEQMAASLTNLAKENGLTGIDHIVFSFDNGRGIKAGENVFVVQGELNNPASDKAYMKTDLAVNTPVQDSFQQLSMTNQRQSQDLLVQQQNQQQQIQNTSESRGLSMT